MPDPTATAAATLAGRRALITGASRGIGRAIATRLAAHGAAVVLTSSARSADALSAARDAIRADGGHAECLTAELAEPGEREGLVARAAAMVGSIDILINNAAAIPEFAPASTATLAGRQRLFAINLDAPLDLAQQALPAMRDLGWGRILNISSDTVRQPSVPYAGPPAMVHALALYGASKAALERVTEGLAGELHGSGVLVNALAPHRIAHSESAARVASEMGRTRPEWVEPLETMAEAAYQLVAGRSTGVVTDSRALLYRLQAAVHALDGSTVLGDAFVHDAPSVCTHGVA